MKVFVLYDIETELPLCVSENTKEICAYACCERTTVWRAYKYGLVLKDKYTVALVDIDEEEDDE